MSEDSQLRKRDASKFIAMLEEARSLHRSGDLEVALTRFETVLREVTPDDAQIELAMALNRGQGVSENREADYVDSMLRSELVYVLRGLARPEEATHHARIALYLDQCLYGALHTNVSQCHHDLGICHHDLAATHKRREDIDIALKEYSESEAIDRSIPTAPPVFKRRRERRKFYAQFGFLVDAAEHAKWLADNRPEDDAAESLMEDLNVAGQCLQDLGEHEHALEYAKRAIDVQQVVTGSVPNYLYENLGFLYFEQGRISDAKAQFERSSGWTEQELLTNA